MRAKHNLANLLISAASFLSISCNLPYRFIEKPRTQQTDAGYLADKSRYSFFDEKNKDETRDYFLKYQSVVHLTTRKIDEQIYLVITLKDKRLYSSPWKIFSDPNEEAQRLMKVEHRVGSNWLTKPTTLEEVQEYRDLIAQIAEKQRRIDKRGKERLFSELGI